MHSGIGCSGFRAYRCSTLLGRNGALYYFSKFLCTVSLCLVLMLTIMGCKNGDNIVNDDNSRDENINFPVAKSSTLQARIISLEPGAGSELVVTNGSTTSSRSSKPDFEIQKSEDGTLTIEAGKHFMRPLTAIIGCDGKMTKAHSSSRDISVLSSCKE